MLIDKQLSELVDKQPSVLIDKQLSELDKQLSEQATMLIYQSQQTKALKRVGFHADSKSWTKKAWTRWVSEEQRQTCIPAALRGTRMVAQTAACSAERWVVGWEN